MCSIDNCFLSLARRPQCKITQKRQPWKETLEQFAKRTQALAQHISDNCYVDGALPQHPQPRPDAHREALGEDDTQIRILRENVALSDPDRSRFPSVFA